jgi:hypothetical protein
VLVLWRCTAASCFPPGLSQVEVSRVISSVGRGRKTVNYLIGNKVLRDLLAGGGWRGFIHSKSKAHEGRGVSEVGALRFAFVVEAVKAVEAVGAERGILAVQVVEDVARKRTRCGSWCRAACWR